MNKKILYLIPVILLIFGGIYFVGTKNRSSTVNQPLVTSTPAPENKTSVKIDFGNGQIIETNAIAGETAFEALKKAAENNQLELKTKQYDFGIFIESIGGKENTKELSWIYFINSKSGEIAADKYILKLGDLLEWKYVKPIF